MNGPFKDVRKTQEGNPYLFRFLLAGIQPSINLASGPWEPLHYKDWLVTEGLIRHSSKVSGQQSTPFPGLMGNQPGGL